MILRSLILIKLRNFSGVIRATTEEIAKFTFLFRTRWCTWSYLWVQFYLRKSLVLRASQLQYFIQTAGQNHGHEGKSFSPPDFSHEATSTVVLYNKQKS